jgi:phosphoribosyl-ATP pyrophosphohydrolase/phosphoribosyl-AMP cyclohydrolase
MFEQIKWDERGLVPAIVQDVQTRQVLMMAYMNAESLVRTLETGETVFWSRSRNELWHKGATSGNVQRVREIYADCDGDTLLVLVEQAGPACHTGAVSCFFNAIQTTQGPTTTMADMLNELEAIIRDRKANPRSGSYTNSLFDAGVNKIAQKVGEEAAEVIVAALGQGRQEQIGELSDLIYHTLVLMAQLNISLDDVQVELARRHKS